MSENAALGDSWEAFGVELADSVRDYVAPLAKRIQALDARVKELESRGQIKMCGVWLAEREYETGNLAVSNGSLWCAQARTKSRPGSSSDWLLIVKQGTFSK